MFRSLGCRLDDGRRAIIPCSVVQLACLRCAPRNEIQENKRRRCVVQFHFSIQRVTLLQVDSDVCLKCLPRGRTDKIHYRSKAAFVQNPVQSEPSYTHLLVVAIFFINTL